MELFPFMLEDYLVKTICYHFSPGSIYEEFPSEKEKVYIL